MPKIVVLLACFYCVCIPLKGIRAEILVPGDGKSTWSLNDDGSQPGANWHEPHFDDSHWRAGPGHLDMVKTVFRQRFCPAMTANQ